MTTYMLPRIHICVYIFNELNSSVQNVQDIYKKKKKRKTILHTIIEGDFLKRVARYVNERERSIRRMFRVHPFRITGAHILRIFYKCFCLE